MQRTIVMIRHAKSSWTNPLQSDFERPLNDRGEIDAPAMGEKLKNLSLLPDLIISSPAKRTKQTAKKIANAIGYNDDKIQWEEKLYHCIPQVFEEIIYNIDDKTHTVFIVAHNPGITEFVNQLSPEFTIDNMPTCGIVAARMNAKHWTDYNATKRTVFLFEYPKKDS